MQTSHISDTGEPHEAHGYRTKQKPTVQVYSIFKEATSVNAHLGIFAMTFVMIERF